MASEHQLRRTFDDLGALYAAEHHEQDDEGAQHVQGLIKRLRRFAAREQAERERQQALAPTMLSEATYDLSDGRQVYYDDGRESLRDAADLSAVLPEEAPTGSPNLENLQARHILDRLQTGWGLGEVHIGTLRRLLTKHRAEIKALRRKRDRDGQDPLDLASDGPDARIIPATERT